MSSATSVSIRQYRGRMARTMLLILMPLALIPIVLIGSAVYIYGRDFLRQQTFTLLSTVVENQGQRIVEQVATGELLLARVLRNNELRTQLDAALVLDQREDADFKDYRNSVFNQLQIINQPKPYYNQFLVIKPDGLIHMATNRDWQGQKITDQDFLRALQDTPISRAGFAPKLLYNTEEIINRFVIISIIPYHNQRGGEPQAYVLGVAESSTIREFIHNAAYYTNQVYFVTPDGNFIAQNPYPNSFNKLVTLQPPPSSENLSQLISHNTTPHAVELEQSVFAHREAVIAAHTWLENLQIGWAAEVPQSAVYSQIDTILTFGTGILLALLIIIGLVVWLLTHSLTRPILQLVDTVQRFTDGNWEQRSDISRNDEVGLLADSFNTMADELTVLYNRLENQVRERTGELNTLAQLSQVAISSRNLDELLKYTLEMTVTRFNCKYAAAFLVDQTDPAKYASLRQAAGSPEIVRKASLRRIPLETNSLIGTVILENLAQVRPLISTNGEQEVGNTQPRYFEAAIPISIGDQVLGAINLYSAATPLALTGANPFSARSISELQTMANHIASSIRNFLLLENSQINQEEADLLYKASHKIAQAESEEELHQITSSALKQCSFRSAILIPSGAHLQLIHFWPGYTQDASLATSTQDFWAVNAIPLTSLTQNFSAPTTMVYNELNEVTLPREIYILTQQLGCEKAAFIPIVRENLLSMLLVLGKERSEQIKTEGIHSPTKPRTTTPFASGVLQPYKNLAELYSIALEKIRAQSDTRKRIDELEVLWKIGQTISFETDLRHLFRNIHSQIEQLTGKLSTVGFGLYDASTNMIQFPYLYEEGEALTIPNIPLGQGLTSIVLRTKRPLRLVENTEQKTIELGALTVGKPAKSWLGIPLLFGGEAIGIIIAQDNDREQRFSEDDERLLSTLAAQISVVVRNARLFETSRRQAEHEKMVSEITDKLRQSVDLHNILKITAEELSNALNLRKAHIEILPELQPANVNPDKGEDHGHPQQQPSDHGSGNGRNVEVE